MRGLMSEKLVGQEVDTQKMFEYFLTEVAPGVCTEQGVDAQAMAAFAAEYKKFFNGDVLFRRDAGCALVCFEMPSDPGMYSLSVVVSDDGNAGGYRELFGTKLGRSDREKALLT